MLLDTILIVLCVLSALILLFLVLLHSGRGGGLSDMFGGGVGATAAVSFLGPNPSESAPFTEGELGLPSNS